MEVDKISDADIEGLVRAFSYLDDEDDIRRFLKDLITEQELVEFAKRWKAARLLDEGVPYAQIERITRLSSTTIARVSKWLRGSNGGYRAVLDRVKNASSLEQDSKKSDTHTFRS